MTSRVRGRSIHHHECVETEGRTHARLRAPWLCRRQKTASGAVPPLLRAALRGQTLRPPEDFGFGPADNLVAAIDSTGTELGFVLESVPAHVDELFVRW